MLNGSAAVAYEIKYRIMGSNAHLWALTPDPEPLSRAAVLLGDLQSLWSRFEPESETNRLNTGWANARSIDISEPTVGLLLRMETAWWMTGGRWDPTVLGSVFAGGYVHSLETGALAPTHGLPAQFAAAPGLGGVEVSTSPPSVYLPAGVAIDPGGMAKGYAADLAVQCLMDYGCAAARVKAISPLEARQSTVVSMLLWPTRSHRFRLARWGRGPLWRTRFRRLRPCRFPATEWPGESPRAPPVLVGERRNTG